MNVYLSQYVRPVIHWGTSGCGVGSSPAHDHERMKRLMNEWMCKSTGCNSSLKLHSKLNVMQRRDSIELSVHVSVPAHCGARRSGSEDCCRNLSSSFYQGESSYEKPNKVKMYFLHQKCKKSINSTYLHSTKLQSVKPSKTTLSLLL